MDPILASLSDSLVDHVEDQLSNNEGASDDELIELFVENGLTEIQARQALTYRSLYLTHMYLKGFTPITKGSEALRLNPNSGRFERD